MEKQSARAQSLRNGEDKSGPAPNSQVQARSSQTQRRMEKRKANAGRQNERMAAHLSRQGGKTVLWELRCKELDVTEWTQRLGSIEPWRMACAFAEALDHDAARIMAFGGKTYTLEMRIAGQSKILRMEISGFPIWKYVANRVN